MRDWITTTIGEFIDFNPSEKLQKNKIAKKIPMDKLGTFERKIKGFVFAEYQSGPKFRNNDTLVAKITPCLENGKTAFVNILDNEEVAFGSSEFIVLRNNKLSDAKFIYYLARSPYFREKAISCMEGTSGRKRVNETALKHLNIKVPPIETQQKIAKILSDIDDKIEILHQINDNLAELAKTIYDYWFVQFDFPDENGKPYKTSGGKMVYNDILKREIPEGWEVKRLGEILKKNETTIKINAKDYLSSGSIPIIDQSSDFICGYTNEISALIKASNIPAIIFGDHTRILKFIDFDFARGADGTQILFSNNEKMPQYLFYHSLLKIDLSNYGYARHFKFLKEQKILLSDRLIAEKFTDNVKTIYEKIKINRNQIQHLQSLRDWLLPMLMNGQVSVE